MLTSRKYILSFGLLFMLSLSTHDFSHNEYQLSDNSNTQISSECKFCKDSESISSQKTQLNISFINNVYSKLFNVYSIPKLTFRHYLLRAPPKN